MGSDQAFCADGEGLDGGIAKRPDGVNICVEWRELFGGIFHMSWAFSTCSTSEAHGHGIDKKDGDCNRLTIDHRSSAYDHELRFDIIMRYHHATSRNCDW